MYIAIINNYHDTDPSIFCGYIQIDSESPMKITHIRVFKRENGFHTIKYWSGYPNSASVKFSKTISDTFSDDNALRIEVNATSHNLSSVNIEPEFEIINMSSDAKASMENMCVYYQEMIRESFQQVNDSVNEVCDRNNANPKMRDAMLKICTDYANTIDTRCCLPLVEVQKWIQTGAYKDALNKELGITTTSGSTWGTTAEDEGKSTVVELILCLLLGWLGAHRFYRGKYISALIYMFSAGIYGIGILVDAIILVVRLIKNR